jgi:uncharacterized protein
VDMPTVTLTLLPGDYAISRLAPDAADPIWARDSPVSVIARTADELSVLCSSERVPAGTQCEPGWKLFKFQGPFAFTQTGILAAVLTPLAQAQVGILAVSTFDTDYVLVKDTNLGRAQDALVAAGHVVLTVAAAN